MNRETIFSALYAQLQTATKADGRTPAFVTVSRRFRMWTDVPQDQRPALFIQQKKNSYSRAAQGESAPQKVTLNAILWIYTYHNVGDQAVVPATDMNNLLDAIDRALQGSAMTGLQTLGGLVSHCWIEDDVDFDAGDIDGDGVATIPVKILVPT